MPEVIARHNSGLEILPKDEFNGLFERLVLVRHGKTESNIQARLQGSIDNNLSETGRQKMAEIAKEMVDRFPNISAIVSSNMLRSLETAAIFSDAFKLKSKPIYIVKGLDEYHFGDWEGKLDDDLKKDSASGYVAWQKKPLTAATAGEPFFQFLNRINNSHYTLAINEELPQQEKSIMLITHGTVSRAIRFLYLSAPGTKGSIVDYDILKSKEKNFFFNFDGQIILPPHAPYFFDKEGSFQKL